eukprot:259659-Rhodomonas_salina.2
MFQVTAGDSWVEDLPAYDDNGNLDGPVLFLTLIRIVLTSQTIRAVRQNITGNGTSNEDDDARRKTETLTGVWSMAWAGSSVSLLLHPHRQLDPPPGQLTLSPPQEELSDAPSAACDTILVSTTAVLQQHLHWTSIFRTSPCQPSRSKHHSLPDIILERPALFD